MRDAGPAQEEPVAKVTMPQLGESVAEGTIGRWLKKVGDPVEKGRPVVTVHSDRPDRLPAVLERLAGAIRIGPRPVAASKLIRHLVDRDGVHPWTG